MSTIQEKLAEARRNLLDLSRRNRLLNFRFRGQRFIEVVDELPAQVYHQLVEERRTMQFLAREEAPEDAVLISGEESPSDAEPASDEAAPPDPVLAEEPETLDTVDHFDQNGPGSGTGRASTTADDSLTDGDPEADVRALVHAAGVETPDDEEAFDQEMIDPGAAAFTLPDIAAADPTTATSGEPAARHVDANLQTLLAGPQLQSRLLTLARHAESSLQERGANILHLALGFVRWTAAPESEEINDSPLVLIPVEFFRTSVKRRHAVRLFDDDPLVNPALLELCRRQFRLELPRYEPESGEPLDAYFDRVADAIAQIPGWSLSPRMAVGLFSFAKHLMYEDLDDAKWPVAHPISGHPLIRTIFGEPDPGRTPPAVPQPHELDDAVPPEEAFQVLDADSSQMAAIVAAKKGINLLIEGPPGTGKSQTITNIIAECLAAGKAVLFVAEKAAALDVVKRRLESVGLGDFVAELHSRKASKRVFTDELGRAMQVEHPTLSPDMQRQATELAELRDRLNAYVRALHERRIPLEMRVYDVIGRCLKLADAPEVAVELPEIASLSRDAIDAMTESITGCASTVSALGDPLTHDWRGVGLVEVPLTLRQSLAAHVQPLSSAWRSMMDAVAALCNDLGLAGVTTIDAARSLLRALDDILTAPPLMPGTMRDEVWQRTPAEATLAIENGTRLMELRQSVSTRWDLDAAEEVDFADILQRTQRRGGSPLRWLMPSWWGDRRQLKSCAREGRIPDLPTLLADLGVLREIRTLRDDLRSMRTRAMEIFGPVWKDDRTDWSQLNAYLRAVKSARALVGQFGNDLDRTAETLSRDDRQPVIEAANHVRHTIQQMEEAWLAFVRMFKLDEAEFCDGSLSEAPLADTEARLARCAQDDDGLAAWSRYVRQRQRVDEAGVRPFLDRLLHEPEGCPPDSWRRAVERQTLRLWLDAIMRADPALDAFSEASHERTLERFREVDQRWIDLSRRRVAAEIAQRFDWRRPALSAKSARGLLEAEIRKKRSHWPIRRLLASPAGRVVQEIKPCFMMSPMSVAQFLEPGVLSFDVVIFDEASQVPPADAIGALARGRQLVLVGDEKQLPPTDFFATIDDGVGDPADDMIMTGDLESVLGFGHTFLGDQHKRRLRWHYRSRHESLIEFSNVEFYDRDLRIFPSPETTRTHRGLRFHHVRDGVYFRGRGRFNRVEAERVAGDVIEHAIHSPERTLGVGAFSVAQQRAIEDEVERLRRASSDPRVEQFFASHPDEPFFVKNLETIQGDERDVIMLSVGYGPDEHGRITMNFGPLNRDGGWRRLNVLVTRARERCVLYSSLRHDQLRVDANAPRGVVALKRYLEFAETGLFPVVEQPGGAHESPFEACVAAFLRERGHDVHAQVGCAGFSVDLAIVDPHQQGRYLVGIECDGATYHSSATARDRDRLRQSVLERLGWTILRIWSTDWFHHPLRARETLGAAIDNLLAQSSDGAVDVETTEPPPIMDDAPVDHDDADADTADEPPASEYQPGPIIEGMSPYERFAVSVRGDRDALLKTPLEALASLLREIVAIEGPIHRDKLLRVATDCYDCRAAGHARDRVLDAIRAAQDRGLVLQLDDFLWLPEMDRPTPRWRGTDDAVTQAELIPPEEVAEVVRLAVAHERSVPRDDLLTVVIRAMGFSRTGTALSEVAEQGIRLALERGLVQPDQFGHLIVGDRATT